MLDEFISLNGTYDWAAVEWRHEKAHCNETQKARCVLQKGRCFRGMRLV